MSIQVQVYGAETIAEKFENASRRRQLIQDSLHMHQDLILANTRPRTPVRTYRLRGSWEAGRPVSIIGDRFTGVVGNPLFYAHMVERGVRGKPGARMLEKGIKSARPKAEALWSDTVEHLVERS